MQKLQYLHRNIVGFAEHVGQVREGLNQLDTLAERRSDVGVVDGAEDEVRSVYGFQCLLFDFKEEGPELLGKVDTNFE
jgi:hypothetical protein